MFHHHATLDLVHERHTHLIEDARLARLARAHRGAQLAALGGRLRHAASGWRVDSAVVRRPAAAPCPC